LLKAQPSELLLAVSAPAEFAFEMDRTGDRVAARTRVDDWVWTRDYAVPLVETEAGRAIAGGVRPVRPSDSGYRGRS